ncbi:YdhK family protein [Exiguobacterium flavidum]|uniref:YdhK family protein n=1 Tax=Exiguobacterium flavidum TaxID=2184695 RepID=UPI000DF73C40|nr:YdhK family protein [Exiguobacterium flavidum]
MKHKYVLSSALLSTTLLLGACAGDAGHETASHETESTHEGMDHSGSSDVPSGLKEASNPTYPVDSKAIIKSDHMEGMDGAEATIVGAYDTTVYSVSYEPANGGELVKDHKWVIHEELKDAGDSPLKKGDEATIEADHMEGMDGAKATIDSAEQTTVYMVDFEPTDGSEKVTNHKWVTEDELSAE